MGDDNRLVIPACEDAYRDWWESMGSAFIRGFYAIGFRHIFLGMFFIIVSLVFVSFVSSRIASVIPRLFLVDEWDKAT